MLGRHFDRFSFIVSSKIDIIRNDVFIQRQHQVFQLGLHRLHADETHGQMGCGPHVDAGRLVRTVQVETKSAVLVDLSLDVDSRTILCDKALGQVYIQGIQGAQAAVVPYHQAAHQTFHRCGGGQAWIEFNLGIKILKLFGMLI